MLIVISPAKTLDFESKITTKKHTQADFLPESNQLIDQLSKMSPEDISDLMNVSAKIAELNFYRYLDWQTPFTLNNSRQAIFAFKGDVYTGLKAENYKLAELNYAQNHLRILSGLYGLLRPLDLMQAYRLEMGTKLHNSVGKNLYDFWGTKITNSINSTLRKQNDSVLINLASNEYFKSVKPKALEADIVTPVFKDYKNGQYKVISFFAKKARGLMASYIIQNRLRKVGDLKTFDLAGYRYCAQESKGNELVFVRKTA